MNDETFPNDFLIIFTIWFHHSHALFKRNYASANKNNKNKRNSARILIPLEIKRQRKRNRIMSFNNIISLRNDFACFSKRLWCQRLDDFFTAFLVFLVIQSPVWLSPSRLNRLTPRDQWKMMSRVVVTYTF